MALASCGVSGEGGTGPGRAASLRPEGYSVSPWLRQSEGEGGPEGTGLHQPVPEYMCTWERAYLHTHVSEYLYVCDDCVHACL